MSSAKESDHRPLCKNQAGHHPAQFPRSSHARRPPQDVIIDPMALTMGAISLAGRIALDSVALVVDRFWVDVTKSGKDVSFGMPERKHIDSAYTPWPFTPAAYASSPIPWSPKSSGLSWLELSPRSAIIKGMAQIEPDRERQRAEENHLTGEKS